MNNVDSTSNQTPRWLDHLLGLWVVALVLALCPYTSDPATPIKQLLTAGLCIIAVLAVGWAGFGRTLCWHWNLPGFGWLLGWLAVSALAAAGSDYPSYSLQSMRGWAGFALMGFLAAQVCRTPEAFWRIAAWAVGAVALSSVYGHAQGWGWDPFPWAMRKVEEYRGLPSTYGNPNFAGHALLLAIILALGLLAQCRGWRRIPFAAAMLLMAAHLYLTGMRGAWLGLTAAAVLTAVYLYRTRHGRDAKRAALQTFFALAICAVLGGSLLSSVLLFSRGQAAPHLGSSSVLRLNGYEGAAQMALERPWLGFGPGVYKLENAPYWTTFEKRWFALEGRKNDHVHCDPLEAAVDAGAPGAFLLFALLAYAILAALTLAGRSPAHRVAGLTLAAAFAAFAVDGLVGFNLRVPVSSGLFFLLFGMLEGMSAAAAAPRRRLWAPSLLLLLALGLTYAEAGAFRAEWLFQRGTGASQWAEQNPNAAPNQIDQALRESRRCFEIGREWSPWDGRFPAELARMDRESGQLDEAVPHLEEALTRQPHHPGLWVELAMLQVNRAAQKQRGTAAFETLLAEAEKAARHAQALCDRLPLPEEVLGRIALMRASARENAGEPDPALWSEAAAHAETAMRLGPPDRRPVVRMSAQAYLKMGQLDKAQHAFEFCGQLDPRDEPLWREFRDFAVDHGRDKAFQTALGRTLRQLSEARDPMDKTAGAILVRHLAWTSVRLGGPLEWPQRQTREWLAQVPEDEKLWGAYIQLFSEAQRDDALDTACRELGPSICPERIQALTPATLTPLDALATRLSRDAMAMLSASGQDEVSETFAWMADRLIARLDASPSMDASAQGLVLRSAGQIQVCARNWAQAEPILRRALPLLTPKDALSVWVGLSMALAELHRPPEALQAAQEAERLDPEGFSTRWNLARRLVEAGRGTEAKFHYAALLGRNVPPDTRALLEQEAEKLESQPTEGTSTP